MVAETQHVVESAGALGALGVDLKLFIAQLVNFGVVFFVMWKWVYKPLLKTMDERSSRIEQGLKDADAASGAKRAAEVERDKLIDLARSESKRIIEEAGKAAEMERLESIAKAKTEVERVVAQGKERLAAEQRDLIAGVRAEAASLVTMATEKVLRAKLDGTGDAKLVDAAIKEVV